MGEASIGARLEESKRAMLEEQLNAGLLATANGCLEWQGKRDAAGYGVMWFNGRSQTIHRLAYLLRHGSIPPNMGVLHRCDNRACGNVDHHFLGDNVANMKDRAKKGRYYNERGEATAGRRKLSAQQVLEIRHLYATGQRTQTELAREYGLNGSAICKIINRYTWRRV